jgi:hypothetical protein
MWCRLFRIFTPIYYSTSKLPDTVFNMELMRSGRNRALNLSLEEVKRFYQIWFPLLHYVNEQRHLVPSFPAKWGKSSVDPATAIPLRDALWADDTLLERFVSENPAKLTANDLKLAASWKTRVTGQFFIFRYLKKYTIFLSSGSPTQAYGVLGLTSPIEDMAGPHLPIYVATTLIPFEDRIIYDSLIAPYSVYFGGGIRSDLNEAYRAIQESRGIITTLGPATKPANPEALGKDIKARNKKILTAFQKSLGQAGLSPKMMEEHTENINRFADDFLLKRKPPRGLLELTVDDIQAYKKTQKGKINTVSFKRFAQFLRDTRRINYEQAEAILAFLKRKNAE